MITDKRLRAFTSRLVAISTMCLPSAAHAQDFSLVLMSYFSIPASLILVIVAYVVATSTKNPARRGFFLVPVLLLILVNYYTVLFVLIYMSFAEFQYFNGLLAYAFQLVICLLDIPSFNGVKNSIRSKTEH